MSVRTKVGLGFSNYISKDELGWDDSAFSVFTTNSKEVEGRPHFNSDKSSEVNSNDFASNDSSVNSSEPKSNDSTSCASTSSISTSESEVEFESNVGTPIQETINVQDLPSFSCNSSDKNGNTSRTSCNKNTQMANKTVGNGVGPVHSRNNVNRQNQFVPQAVLLRNGKVNITHARPQSVPTGKPKVPAPVPTGRQNRPILVPTGRGDSPLENSYTDAEDEGIFDSGYSRSMTGNMERLDDFQEFQGGKVTFGGGEGRITGKGTIKTPTLDFENVYYVKELPKGNFAVLGGKSLVVNLCMDRRMKIGMRLPHPILKDFLNLDENMLNKKVKAIRCDNGTEFKNAQIIELCGSKGIKRDYSNARTPQQNGVAERKNRTLIEAARTMLADSKLPTIFWTEVVRTACYVLNRVLVTSPYNKTPYALLTGNIPSVSHFKPFGCHVTILNTSDHLGKFDGKADEGYIVGYSASNKAYRVYNVPTKRVEEMMNLRYLEEKPNRIDTDADSDSDCDEKVIIIPFLSIQHKRQLSLIDFSGDELIGSPLDSAEEIFQKELARLKGQEQRATSDAKDTEELQERASTKSVPTGSIQIPSGETTISTGSVSVPTGSPTDSFFDDEPTTRDYNLAKDLIGIFINQDKYVQEILKKFDLESVRTATTPYEAPKPSPDRPTLGWVMATLESHLLWLEAIVTEVDIMAMHEANDYGFTTSLKLEYVVYCKLLWVKPALGFMRPFGYPVTILNTIDHLGKFDGKVDEGFFIGYSINRSGPNWLFDIDALTKSMNYKPIFTRNQSNGNASTKACDDAGKATMETVPGKDYILLPLWLVDLLFSQSLKSSPDAGFKPLGDDEKKVTEEPKKGGDSSKDSDCNDQEKEDNVNGTNNVNAASTNEVNDVGTKINMELPNDPNTPELKDIIYSDDDEDIGAEADMNNLDAFMPVSPIPTTRVHKDHPVEQIIGDLNSAPQTRKKRMT
ncbi:putative ribonuclease H-like domain-containing protein [Tanacetum coccineum]